MSGYREIERTERKYAARHLKQTQHKKESEVRQFGGAADPKKGQVNIAQITPVQPKNHSGMIMMLVLLLLLAVTGTLMFSALSTPVGRGVVDTSLATTSDASAKEAPKAEAPKVEEPKAEEPKTQAKDTEEPVIRYAALMNGTWQDAVTQDAVSGSSDEQEAPVQAVRLDLPAKESDNLEYCVADGSGTWTNWMDSGTQAGENGISAIRIAVKGELAQNYNVWYCVRVAGIGWKDWTSNGNLAGASGADAKLSAYRVALLPNSAAAPGPTEEPFQTIESFTSGDAELDAILETIVAERTGTDQDALRKAYEYVSTFYYIKENELPEGDWTTWSVPYAREMYDNGQGNCYRYASLLCWIARYLGYDARVISGRVPMPEGLAPHGWVEIREDGTAYVCDADMHKFRPDIDLFWVTYDESKLEYHRVDYSVYTNENALA